MTKKLSEKELVDILNEAKKLVAVGEMYRHYKGNLYKVIDLGIFSEDIGVGVIYQAQYGEKVMFIRPLDIWIEDVDCNGRTVPRFDRV